MSKPIESIIIVGGGTAGWMAAVYLKRAMEASNFPHKITVVESPRIPTVGVGEGTLLTFRRTLQLLGIDESTWLVRCNGALKMGIKFVDWLELRHSFWFTFRSPRHDHNALIDYWFSHQDRENLGPFARTVGPAVALCEARKSPKRIGQTSHDGEVPYAYHFDAALLATYLKEVALSRGVELFSDTVVDVKRAGDGSIHRLVTDAGRSLTADLFVDCSGFRGLLINEALEEPFVPFNDFLFCDRAVAINIPTDDARNGINSNITATALRSGWVWHIPLYGRSGNGYVYSSEFASPDVAERELRQHVRIADREFDSRHLEFRVGYTRRSFVKNCVSLGLASGFVDPLQATGIFFLEVGLGMLAKRLASGPVGPAQIDSFNETMGFFYEEIRDFLILHYLLTRRTDSPFWRANRNRSKLPGRLRDKLQQLSAVLPTAPGNPLYRGDFGQSLAYAYLNILCGMGYFERAKVPVEHSADDETMFRAFESMQEDASRLHQILPDHYEYLRRLHVRLSL